MKKIIAIVIIMILIIIAFFIKFNYESFKFGNNISNKSQEEIKQYISDIKSYELIANITVESNKNKNEYIIKEECIKENNIFKKEILEPENIKGISFIYNGTDLRIENTKLSLTKMYENYAYIGESSITLMKFIDEFKDSHESNISENDNEFILEIKLKNGNKYIAYKKLYISKDNGNPLKLEIQDITQKTTIYILYNEIKINNLQKEDVLAFKIEDIINDI